MLFQPCSTEPTKGAACSSRQWIIHRTFQAIALFTIVFAAGQIVGPVLVGWVSDGAGGLLRGFALSAALLAAGSLLALGQRPLPR